jgi:hypothetical protein
MTVSPLFLVVSSTQDALAEAVRDELSRRDLPAAHVTPSALASLPVVLTHEAVSLWGQPLLGVLWRAKPDPQLPTQVPEPDRDFAANEVRALWAAVLDRPDVFAVPNLPPEHWLSRARWMEWRRHLDAVGIPLSPLCFGAGAPGTTWHPYTDTSASPAPGAHLASAVVAATGRSGAVTCLVAAGRVCDGEDTVVTRRVASWLSYWEAGPTEVTLDEEGAVLRVDSPAVISQAACSRIAPLVVEAYLEHLAGG